MKRIAIDETRQRVVLRQIANSLGFALAHGDVAQDRTELNAVGALPARETGLDRKLFAIAAASVEFDQRSAGEVCDVSDRERRRGAGFIAGANLVERPADHLLRQMAEYRRRTGIPHRDQVIGIGADQAVAERHRHALKPVLGDPAQQIPDVDLVKRDGRDVDDDGDVKQRSVENEREYRLQQVSEGLDADRQCGEHRHAPAGGETAPCEQHDQSEQT